MLNFKVNGFLSYIPNRVTREDMKTIGKIPFWMEEWIKSQCRKVEWDGVYSHTFTGIKAITIWRSIRFTHPIERDELISREKEFPIEFVWIGPHWIKIHKIKLNGILISWLPTALHLSKHHPLLSKGDRALFICAAVAIAPSLSNRDILALVVEREHHRAKIRREMIHPDLKHRL